MHLSSGLTLLSLSLFASRTIAQELHTVPVVPTQNTGTEPIDGSIKGTKRYNVTFRNRSFTLDEFREAVENGAGGDLVDRIVADLQIRAQQEHEGFRKAIEARGGRVVTTFWLIDACTVEIKPTDVAAVADMANVLEVRPDLPTYPLILTSTNASNHNSDAVQAAGNRGTGFATAIVDTGQDSNMGGTGRPHQTYFRNGNIAITNAGGLNGSLLLANVQLPGTSGADDQNNHGTGVCSITSGSIWGGAGADNGHANDAFKVGYSICITGPGCGSSLAIEALGFQQATADKVKFNIVSCNMSYSSTSNVLDVSQQAIDAAALNGNIVPCTAAGNTGTGGSGGSAATLNGLSVAAANPNSKTIAGFSTRGPQGAMTFPAITANGVSTVMAQNNNDNANFVASGTSMASPQVCGVAALVKFARPTASAREIKAILLASCENVAGYTENDGGQGYLRTDRASATATSVNSVVTADIASTATPIDLPLSVVSGQVVKVALTWFRHNIASTAYSNLGLTILNGATPIASKDSAANLYEVVTFTAPITGNLTVRVSATSLAISPQPYSLAVNATSGTQPAFGNGTSGSYVITGAGCVGTGGLVTAGGIPSMHPSGNPRIGASFVVNLNYAKTSSVAILFLGFTATTIDLTAAGAPGCIFRSGFDILSTTPTTATATGSVTYPIPNDASLVNAQFHNQYLVFDAAANALDFVVSNSARGTIGNR